MGSILDRALLGPTPTRSLASYEEIAVRAVPGDSSHLLHHNDATFLLLPVCIPPFALLALPGNLLILLSIHV